MQEYEEKPAEQEEEIAKPRIWYVLQLISLILVAIIGGAAFQILGTLLAEKLFGISAEQVLKFPAGNSPELVNAVRLVQVMSVLGLFVFSSLTQLTLMRAPVWEGLGINTRFTPIQGILAVAAILALQPAISAITSWNLSLHLPESLKHIEEQLITAHQLATDKQSAFFQYNTWMDFLANLFMIGLIAAFCEELFFRRIMLRLLYDSTGNVHVSIFISALLFALLHGQFFYMIPLFGLGLLLGYLAYWSKSLWLPVLVHFVHNSLVVFLQFFVFQDRKIDEINPDMGSPVFATIASVLLGGFLIIALYKRRLPD